MVANFTRLVQHVLFEVFYTDHQNVQALVRGDFNVILERYSMFLALPQCLCYNEPAR